MYAFMEDLMNNVALYCIDNQPTRHAFIDELDFSPVQSSLIDFRRMMISHLNLSHNIIRYL